MRAFICAALAAVCLSTAAHADPYDPDTPAKLEMAHRTGAMVEACVKQTVYTLMRAGMADRNIIKEMVASRCAGTFYNNHVMPKGEAISFTNSEADLEIDNLVARAKSR